jgi:AcrR family transcriptional regulator
VTRQSGNGPDGSASAAPAEPVATRRRRTPSAGLGAGLVDAAAELLEREGPDALSIRRIAAEANVAPMGVYNHFDSKNGIVDALFIRGFEQLGDAMERLNAIEDPMEALRRGGQVYRALALAHPKMYQVMFLKAVPYFEPSDAAVEVSARAFGGLIAAVSRAMAAGALAEASPTLTAQMIWSSIHGWVSLEVLGLGFVEDTDTAFPQLCATLLRGLAPPGPLESPQ